MVSWDKKSCIPPFVYDLFYLISHKILYIWDNISKTMNYKRSIFSIALLLGSLAVQADPTYVTIEQKSGSKIDFLLSENPVFTFSKGDLVVNGDAKTSYAVSGVKNYHFTNTVTDLGKVAANSLRVVYVDKSTIKVQNAEASAVVSLVDATGKVVLSAKTDSEGSATVGLPQVKGVYVLTVADKSFKVIRK